MKHLNLRSILFSCRKAAIIFHTPLKLLTLGVGKRTMWAMATLDHHTSKGVNLGQNGTNKKLAVILG